MTAPSWIAIAETLLSGKDKVNGFFAALEAVSPDVFKASEESAKAAILGALDKVNAADLKASAEAVLTAVEHGGVVGGGADANLA